MGLCRNLDGLHPEMRKRLESALAEFRVKGIEVYVNETVRSEEVQAAYYAQGRKPIGEVNRLRAIAGLWGLSPQENTRTITNCDGIKNRSNHQKRADGYGHAVDLVPIKGGYLWWNAPEQVWTEIGAIAEKHGLDWCAGGYGATWGKGWDNPHFEWNGEQGNK